jgi:hypothetical protein
MSSPATIAAIGSAPGGKFVSHKVPGSGTAVSAPGKDPDVINKVIFI